MLVISNLVKSAQGKVLICKLNQNGENVEVTVLKNTTGIIPTVIKQSVGTYILSGFENVPNDKFLSIVHGGNGVSTNVRIGGGPDLNKTKIINYNFDLGVWGLTDIGYMNMILLVEILD